MEEKTVNVEQMARLLLATCQHVNILRIQVSSLKDVLEKNLPAIHDEYHNEVHDRLKTDKDFLSLSKSLESIDDLKTIISLLMQQKNN